MGLKIDLINTVVGQAHGLPESLNGDVSDTIVGICEVSIVAFVNHRTNNVDL